MVVVIAHFQQPVARAQGTVERRHPAGMLAVDRQHQPVEKPPPLRGRAQEQPVHRRRQPHHAQMIAEGGGRTDRLAVDPAAPAGGGASLPGGSMPVPSVAKPKRALDFGGHRPGAVALVVGDIVERGAAQAAAGRQKRDRLEAIGLAGAVRPDQHHDVAARLKARRAIIAEMRQRQAVDAGGGHSGRGRSFFPLPLWERVAPNEVRRRVRGSYGSASFAKMSSKTAEGCCSTSLFQ